MDAFHKNKKNSLTCNFTITLQRWNKNREVHWMELLFSINARVRCFLSQLFLLSSAKFFAIKMQWRIMDCIFQSSVQKSTHYSIYNQLYILYIIHYSIYNQRLKIYLPILIEDHGKIISSFKKWIILENLNIFKINNFQMKMIQIGKELYF